ncbi:MAG: hypothetical protein QOI47_68 [Actinomycetota bacterium]|nr:hypothetical protein [Actinomycetota bacterium]
MSEPVLREARPEDAEGIRACLIESFPDNPKAKSAILAWQYHNPFGQLSQWVYDDGGRIVGHYANYPVPCLLDGVPSIAGVAVDAAVSPDYQGRRMMRPLNEALYADSATKGMRVSLAYPSNPIAVKGIRSAGWLEVARLRTLVLPVDDSWLAQRFHVPRPIAGAVRNAGFRVGRGASGVEVDAPPDGLDALWASTVKGGDIRNGILRDGAWWRWRYADSPMSTYRYFEARRAGALVGAAAVVARDDFGGRFAYLLELMATDREGARQVLRAVTGCMHDISGVATVAVDGGPLHRLATSAGMRTLPRRLEPKGLWFGFVDNDGSTAHLATAPWAISWGDLDHL